MANKERIQKQKKRLRGENGKVTVGKASGRLRLTIPAKYSPTGEQKHEPLRLKDTPANRVTAEEVAAIVNKLISRETYDSARLSEYIEEILDRENSGNLVPLVGQEPDLEKLWAEYIQHKKSCKRKETTEDISYLPVGKYISRLSTKKVSDARIICDELQQTRTVKDYDKILDHLNGCCKFALGQKRILANPFAIIRKETPKPDRDIEPDPFPLWALENIIAAYEKHPTYYYIAPYLKFRAKTGCRPGEGYALKWKNVDLEKNTIRFCESITFSNNRHIHTVGTKTGLTLEDGRTFPIRSPELRAMLEKLHSSNPHPDDFVFQDPKGGHIRYSRFYYSWHGAIVGKLEMIPQAEGGVDKYRAPYNIRHTFISVAVEQMEDGKNLTSAGISELAKYVGNSPATIIKHYLKRSGNADIVNIDRPALGELPLTTEETVLGDRDLQLQLVAAHQRINELNQQLEAARHLQSLTTTLAPLTEVIPKSSPVLQRYEPVQAKASRRTQPSALELGQLTLFAALEDLTK